MGYGVEDEISVIDNPETIHIPNWLAPRLNDVLPCTCTITGKESGLSEHQVWTCEYRRYIKIVFKVPELVADLSHSVQHNMNE
jgi:hypothetical protein